MRKYLLVFVIACFLISTNANAESICDGAEKQFVEAVNVYKKKNSTSFVERVLKDGPFDGNQQRILVTAQALGKIEQIFGQIQTSYVLSKKAMGDKTCYLTGILEYSNGPLFISANYYQTNKGVAATSIFFNSEAGEVLPKQWLVE